MLAIRIAGKLENRKNLMILNWRCVYADGFVVLAEGLDM
jgi:hypothetical protein